MTLLIKIDPEAHQNRWYLVLAQPSLLDSAAVITAWGSRQTGYQRMKILPAESPEAAEALAAKLVEKKLGRGYVKAGEG